MAYIEVENLKKNFGQVEVLKGISLEINQNAITTILGASGAGKTTLLQIMGTLLSADSGRVSIQGVNLLDLKRRAVAEYRNRHIGFVFQFHQLLPEFSAVENAALPMMIRGERRRKAFDRATYWLRLLGLEDRVRHHPNQLSGGEKQRVAIARALINDPDVLLADEPTGSLDSERKEELHALFRRLSTEMGQTLVIVTHDEELARLSDRTIILSDGRVAQTLDGYAS